jgi:hypothetical protein
VSAGLADRRRALDATAVGEAEHHASWLRPQLRRVLHEVLARVRGRLRQAPARAAGLHPVRAASVRLPGRAPRSDRLAAAERELVAVHRAELAFLLREASRLRRGSQGAASGEPTAAERACRDGLDEALGCARGDALALPSRWQALVRACIVGTVDEWPQASTLARLSLEVEPCAEGRVELARAHLAEGRPEAAGRGLATALLTCPSARRGADLLDELARLEERLGRGRRARALRGWAARTREVA